MEDLIRVRSSVLPEATRVLAFRGTEAVSRPYEIEIFLEVDGRERDAVDLAEAPGARATLRFDRGTSELPPFLFSGIFASVELVHETDGAVVLRAVLVPRLWLLGLSRHSRVFTRKSLPEILAAVLEDNGIGADDVEMRLGAYEIEEHVCQYRESDLAFLSRWMEREGIYYFFEHGEDGEKLVLSDAHAYGEDELGVPVRYFPDAGGGHRPHAAFTAFRATHSVLPAAVKVKDYDYARPNLTVSGASLVSAEGAGDVHVHGDRFFTPAAGARLAAIRAEEIGARRVVFHAAGDRTHLRAGHVFELEDHPRAALNAKYLAVEVRHHGNQTAGRGGLGALLDLDHDEVYFVEATAIPAATQLRAASTTPWPRIHGHENGVIDGPADSPYAQVDDQGRYSVKLKLDESALHGGKASTFLRMMQPHGGTVEGFHFPLRKGTEVLVSFLGGDPDRPVIAGVVPNALTPSPITAQNHTKNVLQTGGRNRLEIEDKAGEQRITFSTPHADTFLRMGSPVDSHELTQSTQGNTLHEHGKNFDHHVGQNGGGSWHGLVKDDWSTRVQDGKFELYVDGGTWLTKAKNDAHMWVTEGDLKTDVDTGGMTTTVKGNKATSVTSGDYSMNVASGKSDVESKGSMSLTTQADMNTKAAGNMNVNVDGFANATVKSGVTYTIDKDVVSYTKGSTTSHFYGSNTGYFYGHKENVDVSTSLSMSLSASASLKIGVSLSVSASIDYSLKLTAVDNIAMRIKQIGLDKTTTGAEVKTTGTEVKATGSETTKTGAKTILCGLFTVN